MTPTLARLAEAASRFRKSRGRPAVAIGNGIYPIFKAQTGTGCNIELCPQEGGRTDVYRLKIYTHSKMYTINCSEEEFYMADAVITWFVYPDQAKQMLELS